MKWLLTAPFLGAVYLFAEPAAEEVREGLYLRRIAEYWKEGDFSAAKSRIQNFLSEHPHSIYADHLKAMLGDLFSQEGSFGRALAIYEQIEQEEWKNKTLLSSIQCLYQEKLYDRVLLATRAFLDKDIGTLDEKNLARFIHAEAHYYLGEKEETLEKKIRLFEEAIPHYQVLKATSYADQTLYPLAKMAMTLGDLPEAACLYKRLSAQYIENQEEFLFQAALCETQFNPKEAIQTFAKVYPLKGRFAADSAFYELELLFQEDRHQNLLEAYAKTSKLIDSKKQSRVDYYVGRSLFALADYAHAIPVLTKSLKTPGLDKHTLKNILVALCISAEKTEDAPLFEKSTRELYAFFGEEREVGEILILHAQFCQKTGALDAAQKDFELLTTKFPELAAREAILYDYAVLLSRQKQWKKAESIFETLLTEFPRTEHLSLARRHQIFCLFEDLKSTPIGTETLKRQHLVRTIQVAMEDESVFSKAEKKQIHYLLGKTLYDLQQFDDALVTLGDFVRLYPKDAHAKQAHLLIAYSHLQGSQDETLFVLHAEKALAEKAVISDLPALHLQLYNAYLNLAKKESEGSKHTLIDEAASHLFSAIDQPVGKENLFWLASHFEKKTARDPTFLPQAITVLEKLLGMDGKGNSYPEGLDPIEIETGTLKLSSLYEKAGKLQNQITLLKALQEEQTKNPTKPWKYQRLVLFELAKSYERSGADRKALDLYDFLIESSSLSPSYFGPAAELQKLQLLYKNLKEKEGPELEAILDGLKSLEIRRKLSSEPTHLDAALTYIMIKTELSSEEDKLGTQLNLMQKMKENFTSLGDPLTEQYLSVADHYPEEKRIFDEYMSYLSIQILRMQGVMQGSQELGKAALFELESMDKKPIHPSLQKWVDMSKGGRPRIR